MAWIIKRPVGEQWIGFRRSGKQYTVRLGRAPQKLAQRFADLVDRLIATNDLGLELDPELRAWLDKMGEGPRRTLTTSGLAAPRLIRTVGSICEKYLGEYLERQAVGHAKRSTIDNVRVVVANVLQYWPPETPLAEITPETAEEFRTWLRRDGRADSSEPLSETTVSRRCRRVREILALAVDRGWVEQNPFRRMKRFRDTNPARDCYVPRDVIEAVIAATPDIELRLILALARYAGVRVPSEVQRLTLGDLNIDARTIRVVSPKTEHLDGHGERLVPLWEPIERHARAVFDAASVGQVFALPALSQMTGAAITARTRRAIAAAGVSPWPKTFVNLRASCERDLFREHPIDDVCTWLGHSPLVALKHYRRSAKVVATETATAALSARDSRAKSVSQTEV